MVLIAFDFCKTFADIGVSGLTCNRLRLLSRNNFEDVELPVQVENHRRGRSFKVDLLSSQKSLAYSLRINVDNFSLLSPQQ